MFLSIAATTNTAVWFLLRESFSLRGSFTVGWIKSSVITKNVSLNFSLFFELKMIKVKEFY